MPLARKVLQDQDERVLFNTEFCWTWPPWAFLVQGLALGFLDALTRRPRIFRWSPNNSRIVFQSDRENLFSGSAEIYVMNWDGGGQTRLTSDANDESAPVWSPDGTKIAFRACAMAPTIKSM